MPKTFHTIITYPILHPDLIVAIILLKKFGEEKFPGISKAKIEFKTELKPGETGEKLEQKGIICLDMGGGRFDHHRPTRIEEKFSVSDLVAQALKISDDPAFEKILTYARRDDLEGKGTVSRDPIDRAFGMSGLIQNLNRAYPSHPEKVLEICAPLFLAHIKEEKKRAHEYPKEYMRRYDEGKVDAFIVPQGAKQVRCITIESDVQGMVGFLRAHPEIQADVVAQRFSSGHINIVTRQWRKINLKDVVAIVRVEEARKKKIPFDKINWRFLFNKGKMKEIPEWYYDTAANTLQNGGMLPEQVSPTNLTLRDIKRALKIGLDFKALARECPKTYCLLKKCSFYFYNLARCRKIRMAAKTQKQNEKQNKR